MLGFHSTYGSHSIECIIWDIPEGTAVSILPALTWQVSVQISGVSVMSYCICLWVSAGIGSKTCTIKQSVNDVEDSSGVTGLQPFRYLKGAC